MLLCRGGTASFLIMTAALVLRAPSERSLEVAVIHGQATDIKTLASTANGHTTVLTGALIRCDRYADFFVKQKFILSFRSCAQAPPGRIVETWSEPGVAVHLFLCSYGVDCHCHCSL